jgi:RNA polymerase sigma factor (sigma-70 family)
MQTMGNTTPSDSELLAEWLKHRRESAFHALVVRYAPLVHMAAKRTCGDDALAADASQLVFILLAQKAKSLTSRTSLAGWLHLSAILHAKRLSAKRRSEFRKLQHLHSAMDPSTDSSNVDSWTELQPVLDAAIASLSEKDREAILLRFYRSLSVKEIAATLGIATDAAQKRLDRATERLREKLTRRGVTTSASLSAVMLAGYASEAKAATISTTILSSKAIAASAAIPTGIFATLSAMKATTAIAPAVIILLSGTWMVSQRLEIAELNRRSERLEASLASHSAESTNSISTVSAQSTKASQATSKIDAKALAAEFERTVSSVGALRFREKYLSIIEGMSAEELGPLLKDLYAIGAINRDGAKLTGVIMPLMLRNHFPYAFEHFLPQLEALHGTVVGDRNVIGDGFEIWAGENLAAADVWLEQQVTAGKLDSKALDGSNPMRATLQSRLFSVLFRSDPTAAGARLAALPEQERSALLPISYSTAKTLSPTQIVEMTRLIRTHLPPKDQVSQIASLASRSGKSNMAEAAGFLDSIQATPSERNAVAMSVAAHSFNGTKATQTALDEFRTLLGTIAPQQIDAATGNALAYAIVRNDTSFNDAAALALHYHEAGAGDDLLIRFLGLQVAKNDRPAARLIAEKISNPQRRKATLNHLK